MDLQNLDENVINILYEYLRGREASQFLRTGRFSQAGPRRPAVEEARNIKEVFTKLTDALRRELDHLRPDFSTILELLNAGVDVNTITPDRNTALTVALQNMYPSNIIKQILKLDPNIFIRDLSGYDALDWALISADQEIVKELLQRGANLNKNNIYQGVLCAPTYINNIDFIKFLFENGLEYDTINQACEGLDYSSLTPFLIAVEKGYYDLVQWFLDHGANIERDGEEALGLAARIGNFELIKLLIERGANIRGLSGTEIVCEAVFENDKQFLEFLIQNGIDRDEILNPCRMYRYSREYQGIIQDYNENGDLTPFLISVIRGNQDIAELLLQNGADIDDIDDSGISALIFAVIENDVAMVKWLIEHGADLEIEDDDEGWTALTYAQELDYTLIEKILKQAGAEEQ